MNQLIGLFFILCTAIYSIRCVSFESPRKEDNSMRDKIDSLKNVKFQRDISIQFITIKSRRKLSMSRNNFQYFIYYTPMLQEFIKDESNSTDYSTYLKDIDIDFTLSNIPLPEDYQTTLLTQYQLSNTTQYTLQETFSFSAQRQDSLYNLNDFLINNTAENVAVSLDEPKLMEFLSNKNQIEGNTNTIFVIVNSEISQIKQEINLIQYISQKTKQSFLYGFMHELDFYSEIGQANEVISNAYFQVDQNILLQQRNACLKQYLLSIENIEKSIISNLEAGSQLLSSDTKLSDIFELGEYFEFQQLWEEINTKFQIFFYLISMNKYKKAFETIQEVQSYFTYSVVPFLQKSLTKEDVEQDTYAILQLLQQYTFSLLLLVFLLIFVYIYIKKSKVLDLFGKKFV